LYQVDDLFELNVKLRCQKVNLCSHYCESSVFIFSLQIMVPHENQHTGSLKKFGNSDVEVFLYGL